MFEITRAKTELERTCDNQDLLAELAATETNLKNLHTRRDETEFALKQREARAVELKDASFSLSKNPEGITRDEAETRKQIEDLRDRAAHQEKEIGELMKTLAAVASEIAATEKAGANLRDLLMVP